MPLPVKEERTLLLTATKRESIDAKKSRGRDILCHQRLSQT
jgi:hypothetical protein